MKGKRQLKVVPTGAIEKEGRKVLNIDVLSALQRNVAQYGILNPGDRSEKVKLILANVFADEVTYHIEHGGKSAIGWYKEALGRAKDEYHKIFDEIAGDHEDPESALLFNALLGITSQGNDIAVNSVFAVQLYQLVKREGKSLTEAADLLHFATPAIVTNLKRLDELLTRHGYGQMRNLLDHRMTVKELMK